MRRARSSEHLVKLEAVYETENSVYLVIELLTGGSIFEPGKIYGESLFTKMLLFSILEGIQSLRDLKIIHRDLKPENMLLAENSFETPSFIPKVKFIDLGLALDSSPTTVPIYRRCGTPGYMAPENILMDKNSTTDSLKNCDIFSAGVIFFSLLTGE
jgi:serine/threonine protein kinase